MDAQTTLHLPAWAQRRALQLCSSSTLNRNAAPEVSSCTEKSPNGVKKVAGLQTLTPV